MEELFRIYQANLVNAALQTRLWNQQQSQLATSSMPEPLPTQYQFTNVAFPILNNDVPLVPVPASPQDSMLVGSTGVGFRQVGPLDLSVSRKQEADVLSPVPAIIRPTAVPLSMTVPATMPATSVLDYMGRQSERLKCRFCNTTWAKPNGLRRHEREYHSAELHSLSTSMQCETCKKPFISRTALTTHLNRNRTCSQFAKINQIAEKIADSSSSSTSSTASQIEDESSSTGAAADDTAGSNKQAFKCAYCPTVCSAITTLRVHERQNHADKMANVRSHSCPFCGLRFSNPHGLSVHMAKSSGCRALRMSGHH